MNSSYTNAASSREKERKSRYEVNVINENVDEEEIAAFRRFKKYQNQTGYKAKGIKGFTVPGSNLQKTTFAIIVTGKVTLAGIAPGIIYLDAIRMSIR